MDKNLENVPFNMTDYYIGLGLALSSSGFIGASFIIKKKALIQLSLGTGRRAANGGYGYLRNWLWWLGLSTMAVGEIFNFAAYAFAPASVVAPLGALSVIISAILSTKYLKEQLNLLAKIGCFMCVIGSTVMVIHSPKEGEIDSMDILLQKLTEPGFIIYTAVMMIIIISIFMYFGPRYGSTNVIVYVIMCSAAGSLTVMWCKGLGLAIRETISGQSEFTNWLTYMFILLLVVFVSIQMNYLNKALDTFNTGVVTPVYYVMFTSLVIAASAILFKEWDNLYLNDIIGIICGFLITVTAIFMLNSFRDVDMSHSQLGWRVRQPIIRKITIEEIAQTSSLMKNNPQYGTRISTH
ncbi:magnesium transporter NIPA2 isoform X2 [Daktulosphaira vitifoliae]|uniref:magnesium transporter NIPA2 isoform X2 n=1 Tax=Daktulosphaira vitifoliae TaxID=58002 RepID=UPI0021AAFDCD|nr:magnesium transporter NIPA2 isoform X2 [Daktulosphaira vitifoliae]